MTCGGESPGVVVNDFSLPIPISNACTGSPAAGSARTSTAFSYQAAVVTQQLGQTGVSLLDAPDGPPPSAGSEPGSRIFNSFKGSPPTGAALSPYGSPASVSAPGSPAQPSQLTVANCSLCESVDAASGFRLVAGAGDVEASCGASGCGIAPDGYMDWAVGEVTAGANAGQAVVFTTAPNDARRSPADPGFALNCTGAVSASNVASCHPRSPQEIDQQQIQSDELFALSSYALNGYTLADPGRDVGWAVGDRGALWSRGSTAPTASEPSPPQLGEPAPAAFSDTAAYAPFIPASGGTPGVVPPLSARPFQLTEPQFVAGGSPNPGLVPLSAGVAGPESVASIAMSPDGSEGWAVGPTGGAHGSFTLDHYVNGRWQRCDPVSPAPLLPADPACAGVADLLAPDRLVQLRAVATIPGPPGPAGFQAVAVGSQGSPSQPLVLRYAGGRWSTDSSAMSQLGSHMKAAEQVVMTAPDDGWIVGQHIYLGSGTPPAIFHFDG